MDKKANIGIAFEGPTVMLFHDEKTVQKEELEIIFKGENPTLCGIVFAMAKFYDRPSQDIINILKDKGYEVNTINWNY